MPGQQFFPTGAWLAHCCKKNRRFCTSLRNIATADDGEHAHLFVCQILGVLRRKPLGLSMVNGWSIMAVFMDLL